MLYKVMNRSNHKLTEFILYCTNIHLYRLLEDNPNPISIVYDYQIWKVGYFMILLRLK